MEIFYTKLSDAEHKVEVVRQDGSRDSAVQNSRSYLRHDLAHFAVESEIPIKLDYWGSVANGASLTGEDFGGEDIFQAEKLTGPVKVTTGDADHVILRYCWSDGGQCSLKAINGLPVSSFQLEIK